MRSTRSVAAGERLGHIGTALLLIVFSAVACRPAATQSTGNRLLTPTALAFDAAGDLYIADANREQVLEATLAGTLVVVAGTGTQGFSGDGGPASEAQLNSPQGLAFGPDGTLYIADAGNARIRAVSAGVITTFAGNGHASFSGDGGPASTASFRTPGPLAVDASGALLVCDTADHRVRRISNGLVATFAGDGEQGFSGEGGASTLAELDSPEGVAVASDGRVFIADTHNNRVRVVGVDGTISTIAGTGQRGFAGDGAGAALAEISGPRGLVVDSVGDLLIADADNQRIRSVSAAGVITTVAGSGSEGTAAEGAAAAQASLRGPRALAMSGFGMPALADTLNGAVRLLTPSTMLFQPAAFVSGRSSSVQSVSAAAQVYGEVTGSVSVSGSVGVPEGTVTLSEAGTPVWSATLNGGSTTFSLPSLSAGAHSFTAAYAGDGLNAAASAAPITLSVGQAQVTATANGASVSYGSPLPALSGTLSGILPEDAGQVSAVFSASAPGLPGVGIYPIAATLTGGRSGNYAVSMAPASGSLQITQAASRIALGNVAQSYIGLPLRLTANVSSVTSGQPTGTVQFLDGGVVIATAPVQNGSVTAVYVSPPAGTRSLSAQYSGDANFNPSTSALEEVVVSALPDFALTAAGSATATVAAGSAATYTMQVSSASAPFTGVVVLSATGLPVGATASFSPVQVVPGAGSATVTVSIQTPVSTAALHRGGSFKSAVWAGVGFSLLAFSSKRRRRVLWLLGATLCIAGCGARTVGEGNGGVIWQSYTLQVTGTSTNLVGSVVTHNAGLTLVVQQ